MSTTPCRHKDGLKALLFERFNGAQNSGMLNGACDNFVSARLSAHKSCAADYGEVVSLGAATSEYYLILIHPKKRCDALPSLLHRLPRLNAETVQ